MPYKCHHNLETKLCKFLVLDGFYQNDITLFLFYRHWGFFFFFFFFSCNVFWNVIEIYIYFSFIYLPQVPTEYLLTRRMFCVYWNPYSLYCLMLYRRNVQCGYGSTPTNCQVPSVGRTSISWPVEVCILTISLSLSLSLSH